jgi:hypothetical protein
VKYYLISFALFGRFVCLLLGLKDISFFLGGLLVACVGLDSSEVVVVDAIVNLDLGDVKMGGSGQQVTLIDATQWATVQLQRT